MEGGGGGGGHTHYIHVIKAKEINKEKRRKSTREDTSWSFRRNCHICISTSSDIVTLPRDYVYMNKVTLLQIIVFLQ